MIEDYFFLMIDWNMFYCICHIFTYACTVFDLSMKEII